MSTFRHLFIAICVFYFCATKVHAELPLTKIVMPTGFKISLYADRVYGARSMALGDNGVVFVGTLNDVVYAVVDVNKDGKADEVIELVKKLNHPNGVAFKDGALYVAEVNRVLKYDNIISNLHNFKPAKPSVVNNSLPKDFWHGWKYIGFSPDNWLYIPVGAPCNVCEKSDARYGSIMRMKPDGTNLEIYAKGVRNSVGLDFHPLTKELWFTDNGRDWLGDNLPPDELNYAPKKDMFFGFPYCFGKDIKDPEFGHKRKCSDCIPTAQDLGAHVASLGMRFYNGKMFPEEYKNQIFIAEHGSWNRSKPTGYRITLVRLDNNKAIKYEVFAAGWLQPGGAWGRPVDLLMMPDGSLLVSDDKANAIYRITYEK